MNNLIYNLVFKVRGVQLISVHPKDLMEFLSRHKNVELMLLNVEVFELEEPIGIQDKLERV